MQSSIVQQKKDCNTVSDHLFSGQLADPESSMVELI